MTPSGAADANYTISFATADFEITKANLTVRVDDKYRAVGYANPTLTHSFIGFLFGDSVVDIDIVPVLSTTATIDSPIGVYPITISGGRAVNYNFIYISGTLTILMDSDGDGDPDESDPDDDDDGILDTTEGEEDSDGDGIPDYLDLDSDNDGIPDTTEGDEDSDDDGIPDYLDLDSDDDGIPDATEGEEDSDEDGTPDYIDSDDDDDGVLTIDEDVNNDGDPTNDDTDDDGIPNYLDIDDDDDEILTIDEFFNDCNTNGIPDHLDIVDCMNIQERFISDGFSPNGDGVNDLFEIPFLVNHENFSMEVYNRYGRKVYQYNNNGSSNPQWWNGYANVSLTFGNSDPVPVGTYYYIIELNDGSGSQYTGWVYINR
jgi:gliding motility-associated-like protein